MAQHWMLLCLTWLYLLATALLLLMCWVYEEKLDQQEARGPRRKIGSVVAKWLILFTSLLMLPTGIIILGGLFADALQRFRRLHPPPPPPPNHAVDVGNASLGLEFALFWLAVWYGIVLLGITATATVEARRIDAFCNHLLHFLLQMPNLLDCTH